MRSSRLHQLSLITRSPNKPDLSDSESKASSADSPELDTSLDSEPELLVQPRIPAISHEQLGVKVQGIYTGMVMGEAKRQHIDINDKQSLKAHAQDSARQTELTAERWQTLIALHSTIHLDISRYLGFSAPSS